MIFVHLTSSKMTYALKFYDLQSHDQQPLVQHPMASIFIEYGQLTMGSALNPMASSLYA